MDSHTPVLFLMSVTWFVMASSSHHYHFVSEKMNWTNAQTFCRDKFTDLATVDGEEDMTRLIQLAQAHGHSGKLWIGLYQDVDSWRWSLNDSSFYGEGEMDYRYWRENEPYNSHGVECCVEIFNRNWNDMPCNALRSFICYDEKSDPYIRFDNKVTWRDAQRFCRMYHTDLASVRNSSENQQIIAKVQINHGAWIGLYRDCLVWRWSDQSNSTFSNWTSPYPRGVENCAAVDVSTGGGWYEQKCDDLLPFACYSVPKVRQRVRVELKMDSQMNMSDPVVQAAILQQIGQRLREQGVPAEASLKWMEQADGQIFTKKREKKGMKEKRRRRKKRDEL